MDSENVIDEQSATGADNEKKYPVNFPTPPLPGFGQERKIKPDSGSSTRRAGW